MVRNLKKILTMGILVFTLSACQTGIYSGAKFMSLQKKYQQIDSAYSFDDTVLRLKNAIESKGMTIFAIIDHQQAAHNNGLQMQAAKVIIFGSPKAGTPLMMKDPMFALQLPLRVLVTEIDGKTTVAFMNTRDLIAGSAIEFSDVENTLANSEKLIKHTVEEK